MKIAFVNNMNNNFFSIVRYLRDRGIDAHLFIFDKMNNFVPEADTFEDVSKMSHVHFITEVDFRDFFNPFSPKVRKGIKALKKSLADFDLVFACGMLAFFERAGISVDVFIPYGGDVYQLTDLFNYSRKKYFPYSTLMRYIMKYQRRAVQKARVIMSFASHDLHVRDALINMNRKWINWNMAMIYPIACPEQENYWSFLKEYDFVLFSHMRHTWKTGTDYNGNDRSIRGYAQFIKEKSRFQNPIYLLFDYGCDVAASKALISELGIEKYVRWVPTAQRKHIYAGLNYADMVTGIFNEEVISWGGVTYEAFSRQIPVIGCAKIKGKEITHDLPLLHAYEPAEIAAILADFQDDPEKFRAKGKESQAWFERNLGQGLIDKYVELIELMTKHKQARLEDGPLRHLAYQPA